MSVLQTEREAIRGTRLVAATINYLAPTSERPQVWNEDFSRNILPLQPVDVEIEDASSRTRPTSLDVEGFGLLPFPEEVGDLARSLSAAESYRQALRAKLQTLTGADFVEMAGASPVRRAVPPAHADLNNGFPVPFVHSDCTEAGVPHMVAWAYGERPARPIRRMALYNFWRLLSEPPTDLPLAVMDARSLAPEDIVPGSSHFLTDNVTTEAVFVRPNPQHRWSYFSQLTPREVLVFKQFDSDRRYPSQVAHTAFSDATVGEGADPRVSIESRAVAYWFDD